MKKRCKLCGSGFEVTEDDISFLKKVSPEYNGTKYQISNPQLCSKCRQMRRASWRNESKLYKRKCDLTGKDIISIYSSDKIYKVYEQSEWWGDKWDGRDYGADFDFGKSFFEQFKGLQLKVPRPSLFNLNSENSEYGNHSVYNKNCYLCFNTGYSEDCKYLGGFVVKCNYCVDCLYVQNSESLYYCVDTNDSYNSKYLILSDNCKDSSYLFDCRGCSNCYLSSNLRNKEYYFLNEHVGKERYFEKIKEYENKDKNKLFDEQIKTQTIHKSLLNYGNENVTGNFINNSKNVHESYDAIGCEDCKYCFNTWTIKDSMDVFQTMDYAELHYESHASSKTYHGLFCTTSHENKNIIYTDICFNSENLFGCVGLKNHMKYCILNKQYSKEEYEELVPKIIEHMQKTGEWGEFFPLELSPFAYNETVAQEYFPLTKDQVQDRKLKWKEESDELPDVTKIIPAEKLPTNIIDIPDDVLNWAIKCEVSGRPFKLVPQELKFYREHNISAPHLHPDERHRDRMKLRNPRELFDRHCMKCNKDIRTTYESNRTEIIYCEDCYLEQVY